jgi:hypothetical protein
MADATEDAVRMRSYKERDRLSKLFDEAHDLGSQEFMLLWLRANEIAIEAAQQCGFDVSDLRVKTLLSVATLKILRKAQEYNLPKVEAAKS